MPRGECLFLSYLYRVIRFAKKHDLQNYRFEMTTPEGNKLAFIVGEAAKANDADTVVTEQALKDLL